MPKLKIKKNDKVIVISGNYKGSEGTVTKVFPEENRALVTGVNVAVKHTKPSQESKGGLVKKNLKINISNLSLLDPKDLVATKVGYKTLEDGKKVRFAKKSGEVID